MLPDTVCDNNTSPAEISARINTGDRNAEDALVRRHRSRLIGFLSRLTHDHARAEDLAHETLMIVIERLRNGPIDNPDRLDSYIMNTARFHFLGWSRRMGNRVSLVEDCDVLIHNSENGESACLEEEANRILRASLNELSTYRDRDILTRFYLREEEKVDVCSALELDCDHFDKIISRARRRLREVMVQAEGC